MSGFGRAMDELRATIEERKKDPLPGSYTAKLFKGGQDRILRKIGEEAGEVIIASKNGDHDELVGEVCDLLYHTMVLLAHHDVPMDDIALMLEQRRK